MSRKRANEIIRLARQLKNSYYADDPFMLCERFGIKVIFQKSAVKGFTSHILKTNGYPDIIVINDRFDERAKKVLCAHELGHALLHADGINHFAVTSKNARTNNEYEANMFAVALLFDERNFNTPLASMSNYILKSILDYNISQ